MIDFQQTFARVTETLKAPSKGEISLSEAIFLPGMSSSVSLVVDTTLFAVELPDGVSATAQKSTYEGVLVRAVRGVWMGDEILTQEFGIREANASIAEGQFLVSQASGGFLAMRLLRTLDAVDGWYSGVEIVALAGGGQSLAEFGDVYAMANNASIMTSDGEDFTRPAGARRLLRRFGQ